VLLSTVGFSAPFGRLFFFSDSLDNVALVLERKSGSFACLGWGPALTKAGAWSDGRYFFGEFYRENNNQNDNLYPSILTQGNCPFDNTSAGASGFVRCDVDSFVGWWLACTTQTGNYSGNVGKSCYAGFGTPPTDVPVWSASGYARLAPGAIAGQAPLVPVDIYAARDAGGSSLIGSVPNIFLSNAVGSGFAAATDYYLGSCDYLFFPGSPGGNGFAILKN
jgi:hypothetical protein